MRDCLAKKLSAVIVLTLLSLLFVSGVSRAANLSTAGHGITISPAAQQLSLSKGQDSLTFNIGIANNTPNSVVVGLSALDFTSLNQSGGIRFLTTTQQKESNLHYLASSLSFVLPQLALAPSQNIVTPVTINNANQLSPGGHYAAVIFKINSAPLKDTKNPVNINEAVSSLVFVSTQGSGTQSLVLQYVSIGSLFTHFPTATSVILADSGNTQTIPSGVIQILDSRKNIVSQVQINTTSNLILPQLNRLFDFQLTSLKTRPATGYYTFKFYYKTSGQNAYSLYQKRFLYISPQVLYLSITIVVLLLVLIIQRLGRRITYKFLDQK
jgi:hypothetical protein